MYYGTETLRGLLYKLLPPIPNFIDNQSCQFHARTRQFLLHIEHLLCTIFPGIHHYKSLVADSSQHMGISMIECRAIENDKVNLLRSTDQKLAHLRHAQQINGAESRDTRRQYKQVGQKGSSDIEIQGQAINNIYDALISS